MDLIVIARARYSIQCSCGSVSFCHALATSTLLVDNDALPYCLLARTERDLLTLQGILRQDRRPVPLLRADLEP